MGVDITPPGLSCIELKHKCLVNKNVREKNKHGVLLFVYLNYEISREKNGNIAHCEVGAQLGIFSYLAGQPLPLRNLTRRLSVIHLATNTTWQ